MKAASIEFEHVSKVYGEVAAVHDISFAIAPGTLVTLLGPSGCGKTTTLRMIAGLELPSRGTIRIGGADVTRIPASERDVSMVFQSYALFPHMTVEENVSYGLTVSRLPKPQVLERTRAALATVGLTGFDARLPSELSGGQQQRVAVARALVSNPKVILADEPTGNLDTANGNAVMELLINVAKAGTTVVMVTHSLTYAALAGRTIKLLDGRIVSETLLAA